MAALVFGNAAYHDNSQLTNPVNDAVDFSARLNGYGFDVITATDCTAGEMEKQLKNFRKMLETHDIGL